MSELIIIRGLPGSGKSTFAKFLAEYSGYVDEYIGHFEADMFFSIDGEYEFDFRKLKEAHQWCYDSTMGSLRKDSITIVSNTFTTISEIKNYYEGAIEQGVISIKIITCTGDYGSIHGVPFATIEKMRARMATQDELKGAFPKADVIIHGMRDEY